MRSDVEAEALLYDVVDELPGAYFGGWGGFERTGDLTWVGRMAKVKVTISIEPIDEVTDAR